MLSPQPLLAVKPALRQTSRAVKKLRNNIQNLCGWTVYRYNIIGTLKDFSSFRLCRLYPIPLVYFIPVYLIYLLINPLLRLTIQCHVQYFCFSPLPKIYANMEFATT